MLIPIFLFNLADIDILFCTLGGKKQTKTPKEPQKTNQTKQEHFWYLNFANNSWGVILSIYPQTVCKADSIAISFIFAGHT